MFLSKRLPAWVRPGGKIYIVVGVQEPERYIGGHVKGRGQGVSQILEVVLKNF